MTGTTHLEAPAAAEALATIRQLAAAAGHDADAGCRRTLGKPLAELTQPEGARLLAALQRRAERHQAAESNESEHSKNTAPPESPRPTRAQGDADPWGPGAGAPGWLRLPSNMPHGWGKTRGWPPDVMRRIVESMDPPAAAYGWALVHPDSAEVAVDAAEAERRLLAWREGRR